MTPADREGGMTAREQAESRGWHVFEHGMTLEQRRNPANYPLVELACGTWWLYATPQTTDAAAVRWTPEETP